MSTTLKATGAALVAALLTGLLFLSPVGVSQAQDDATIDDATTDEAMTDETTTDETTTDDDADDDHRRGGSDDLTDDEREAMQAEREAARQARLEAFASELGVSADQVTAAARTVMADELAAKVAAGDITQEQADEILAHIDEDGGPQLFGFGGRGGRGGHR